MTVVTDEELAQAGILKYVLAHGEAVDLQGQLPRRPAQNRFR